MRTIRIIGAGEVGSQIARAAIATGYEVVIANSRGPETLAALIADLGRAARAAWAVEAAAAGDFAVIAVPLKLDNDMPAAELAGKIVLDTNNSMAWRDGTFPHIVEGQTREQLVRDLAAAARRAPGHPKRRHAVGPTADGGAPARA